jgi:hypothetical protein
MSEPLGKLLIEFDQALARQGNEELRSWATFLSGDQPSLDPKLVEWSRQLGLRNIPLGVFEDRKGPPQYRLSLEADVTVLLSVNQKVVANFAFRPGELTAEKAKEVVAVVPQILSKKP